MTARWPTANEAPSYNPGQWRPGSLSKRPGSREWVGAPGIAKREETEINHIEALACVLTGIEEPEKLAEFDLEASKDIWSRLWRLGIRPRHATPRLLETPRE